VPCAVYLGDNSYRYIDQLLLHQGTPLGFSNIVGTYQVAMCNEVAITNPTGETQHCTTAKSLHGAKQVPSSPTEARSIHNAN
jgi:hypothetical protein